ncbi:MAG TPA: hypothetical protein VJK72_02170 [Candidatus Nanoarchaeia archaeon]|nr:hypothetical protein [Candidatus Nanoarchaeia archaeon]
MSGFGNIEDELSKLTGANYHEVFMPRTQPVVFRAPFLMIDISYGDGSRIDNPELIVITGLGVVPRRRFTHIDKVT